MRDINIPVQPIGQLTNGISDKPEYVHRRNKNGKKKETFEESMQESGAGHCRK